MTGHGGRRWPMAALALAMAVLAGACGGGGSGEDDGAGAGDDPLEQITATGERPVQVTGPGKVRLGGTLFVPRAAGESPNAKPAGALFVPTIGPGDRNGPVLLGSAGLDPLASDLAKTLGEAGMVTYRYDGRGTGESKLEAGGRRTFDDLVADAKAGLDLLAQRKETAGSDLAVVGYGEGGLVALRLAATDSRVKRVVLISTPGRPLVDSQATLLTAQFGPDSGEALRAAVGQLLTTKTLPPLGELRTELRSLLPTEEIAFLTELYSLDPSAEASAVKVPAMIVAPDRSPVVDALAPERLAQAIPGSELVLAEGVSTTLQVTAPPPADDPSDTSSAMHLHGAGPAQAESKRDANTIGRITGWVAATAKRPA